MEIVLAVDCSTTASKAVAFSSDGTVRALARVEIARNSPLPAWYEQDAREWWEATAGALRQVMDQLDANGDHATALGITHQRESFVCLGDDDVPLRPAILWLDARAGQSVEEYGTREVHRISGKPPSTTPSFYKLAWLKQHEGETLRRSKRIADVHAYLSLKLTNQFATSLASADPTGLISIFESDWSPQLLEVAGIHLDQLPRLVAPGGLIGEVTASASAKTGVPQGLPVVAGGGDGQCAGLGAGVHESGHGYLSLGTSITLGAHTAEIDPSPNFRVLASPLGTGYTSEAFIASGALCVSWFKETFADSGHMAEGFRQELLQQSPPGAKGLFFLPYLSGSATPYWDASARGVFLGITEANSQTDFYRAILEGLAFELRTLLSGLEPAVGQLEKISVMGGGTVSEVWLKIISTVLNRPLHVAESRESTSLGAAILAATYTHFSGRTLAETTHAMTKTVRIIEPDKTSQLRYESLYQTYREIYPSLAPVFANMSKMTTTTSD